MSRSRVGRAGAVLEEHGCPAAEVVEVASLVGLQHVIEEQPAVAAREVRRARLPDRLPPRPLLVTDAPRERAPRGVQLDLITVARARQRPAPPPLPGPAPHPGARR